MQTRSDNPQLETFLKVGEVDNAAFIPALASLAPQSLRCCAAAPADQPSRSGRPLQPLRGAILALAVLAPTSPPLRQRRSLRSLSSVRGRVLTLMAIWQAVAVQVARANLHAA